MRRRNKDFHALLQHTWGGDARKPGSPLFLFKPLKLIEGYILSWTFRVHGPNCIKARDGREKTFVEKTDV